MVKYICPSGVRPKSWIVTVCGLVSRLADLASWRKRRIMSVSSERSRRMTLRATSRSR